MKYYQEITLLDTAEKPLYEIWSEFYTQLHIALADIKNKQAINTIGVNFPNYKYEERRDKTFAILGNKLRVFAPNQAALEMLNLDNWLSKLTDCVHIKRIAKVGNKPTGQVIVKRYRYKNVLKQAKQYAKHKGIELDAALAHCSAHKQDNKPYPYINLKSATNKQLYPLAIVQQPVDNPRQGQFNSYGINGTGDCITVPQW